MRMRRHTEPTFRSLTAAPWGRFARDLGLVALTFVVGYAVSVYWITPGSASGGEHAVPRVLGRPLEEARSAITAAGFRPRLEAERPSAVVLLTPSSGPAAATVPDVIGFALPTAEKVVEAAGVKVGQVDTVGSDSEAGVVIATRPAPGNGRPRGSTVDLVVSGPPGGGS